MRYLALLTLLLSSASFAQPTGTYGPGVVPSLPLSGGNVTGDMTAANYRTVEYYGAKGDCSTDDTAAFNSYAAALRAATGYNQYTTFNLGQSKCYFLSGSVNLTLLSNMTFDGHGSTIVSAAVGKASLDGLQSNNQTYQNFRLIPQGNIRTGIQIGRPLNALSGSSSSAIHDVFLDGTFTEAAVYNRASETSLFVNLYANNRYNSATAYGVIMDGDATWQITSDFAGTYNSGCSPSSSASCQDPLYPHTLMSFNENRFVGGTIGSYYGPAVWMSNARGHAYLDTYVAAFPQAGSPGPAAIVSYSSGSVINDLEWKVHSEPTTLTADIEVTGSQASPVINGLIYRNHIEETNGSVFLLAGSATSATIHNLNLAIPQWSNAGKFVFDNGSNWTVDGYAYTGLAGAWNGPTTLTVNNAGTETYGGVLGSGVTFPSSLPLTAITNTGGVASVTVTNAQTINAYTGAVPTVSIAAPPAGGSQATAVTGTVSFIGQSAGNWGGGTGTGYSVNDVVTFSDGNCSIPIQLKIAAVSGGVPTSIGGNSMFGSCPASEMLLTQIPVTGGGGTGLKINASIMRWSVLTATVTAAGSGYTSAPSVTFSSSSCCTSATAISATSGGAFAINAGGVTGVNVTSSGTTFAAAGTSPITATSPLVMGATKFTTSGCSISATAGSGTAGTYTSGTTGTCTAVLTLNGATGLTAPTGWACSAADRTTPADIQTQTASTTTTATISGTTASGDVVSFNCAPY